MTALPSSDNNVDSGVDQDIAQYLDLQNPQSFFLFAGAGSGKTRSLVEALRSAIDTSGPIMRVRGQQIAVITYTNAACDEIKGRLEHNPLVSVSTIHSFVWDLIKGFDDDIRNWLINKLETDIQEIQEKEKKGRGGDASAKQQRKIESKQKRKNALPSIRQFVYSLVGDNRERDALNHSEVIAVGAFLLTNRLLLRQLLFNRFPILLIDESQDTNKLLMEAFLVVQSAHKDRFSLGLFGDSMQRIYMDGKEDLGRALPEDWMQPAKIMNHRCPSRIVQLINKIRSSVDNQVQIARTDAPEGHALLFVCSNTEVDKERVELVVRTQMREITGDPLWSKTDQVKILILEHHMAAKRMGFFEMHAPLYKCDDFKTGVLDGSLSFLRLFSHQILPLALSIQADNPLASMAVLRKYSPQLYKKSLEESSNQIAQLAVLKKSVDNLESVLNSHGVRFIDVLRVVASENLFVIPSVLYPFIQGSNDHAGNDGNTNGSTDRMESQMEAISEFLKSPFSQIQPYVEYVSGSATFDTHQGVKGREFPRVMVVMDDEEARGFLFSYDKLFGAKKKTQADLKNEESSKETGIDRTRRFFYVTCSRSEGGLALIAYSSNPEAVCEWAVSEGWFDKSEIKRI